MVTIFPVDGVGEWSASEQAPSVGKAAQDEASQAAANIIRGDVTNGSQSMCHHYAWTSSSSWWDGTTLVPVLSFNLKTDSGFPSELTKIKQTGAQGCHQTSKQTLKKDTFCSWCETPSSSLLPNTPCTIQYLQCSVHARTSIIPRSILPS